VSPPAYNTHKKWAHGLHQFLCSLKVWGPVHLLGTSLGGFLAICFAVHYPRRVASLILCNSFADTQYYTTRLPMAALFPVMPRFMLERTLLANFPRHRMSPRMVWATDFMVDQVLHMPDSTLRSRMILIAQESDVNPSQLTLDDFLVTVIDVGRSAVLVCVYV
jgi:pimeloyl-ACP methyl ester carboxylesterase